ncbi:unnamed protein product [Didymodactylos carnosus]|uniref:deoxyhypusine synthase n=1 Tax=Didymodactylos carnosus TaxID=1234261 RepID=A0A8S2PDD7_9BILA|nr:unnamed protein product [Didymodactylos carnosus]CAF4043601.1 unnamed protein product [Didymodactylos carnosus]
MARYPMYNGQGGAYDMYNPHPGMYRNVYQVYQLSIQEQQAKSSIFKKSDQTFVKNRPQVAGYDFNLGVNYEKILDTFLKQGFQATNFGHAIEIINEMIKAKNDGCKIFLGYTSNMVSCGNRDIIRYLVEHKQVDCIVTTAGGIEEDIMKCFAPTYNADFNLSGKELRLKAISRIGNLVIPNDNYCLFEKFLIPILDKMLKEQEEKNTNWTPSKMIELMGKEISNDKSIYYWASKNQIPVFCPAITDGSIGDLIFFHSLQSNGLRIDIAEDIKLLNTVALNAKSTGCLILGSGLVKHHIFNANAMRSGLNYAVVISTAQEYDGSDSGANLDEAVSWAKVRSNAKQTKVFGDASVLFPLLVARTFALQKQQQEKDDA